MSDNTDTVKPKFRVVQFALPKARAAALAKTKTIDEIWHLVVSYAMENPDENTNADLWKHFRNILNMEYSTFKAAILDRGIGKIRKTVAVKRNESRRDKQKSRKNSKEITDAAIESFVRKRRKKSILHLSKMDMIVENATGIISEESNTLTKMKSKDASLYIESHIDKASKLHKLASSVYGIDQESVEEKNKRNLSILLNFDLHDSSQPEPKVTKGKVIDV